MAERVDSGAVRLRHAERSATETSAIARSVLRVLMLIIIILTFLITARVCPLCVLPLPLSCTQELRVGVFLRRGVTLQQRVSPME
jgi:hypothetical protein